MQLGRDGKADVLLVNARAGEDRFVEEGYAEMRCDVMYNDFLIVGPGGGVFSQNLNLEQTLIYIYEYALPFVSRGDDSGTHIKELQLWEALEYVPEENSGYISAGQGMGATLGMAAELEAFTLTDRAAWLTYPDVGNLMIVCEGDEQLLNPYGVMAVSSSPFPDGAQAFIDWILSPDAQWMISWYGAEDFGQPLFCVYD